MNATAKPFARIGDRIEDTIGNTLIRVTRIEDQAFNLYVQNGPTYISELSASFAGPDAAQAACRRASMIRAALKGGVSIHQLIGDAQQHATAALTEAQQIVAHAADLLNARDPQAVAEQINADWGARHAQTVQAHNQLVADVQAIAGGGQGWRNARLDAYTAAAPNTRPLFHGRAARPSDLQRRALDLRSRSGEIRVQPGVNGRTLTSMARKGLGRLVLRGGAYRPYEVLKLVLNPDVITQLDNNQTAA